MKNKSKQKFRNEKQLLFLYRWGKNYINIHLYIYILGLMEFNMYMIILKPKNIS